MPRRLLRVLALLVLVLGGGLAGAHPMPESRVWIDTTATGVDLRLELPLDRLEFAFGQPLAEAPDAVLARHGDALARYVLQHVGARGQAAGWQATRPELAVEGGATGAELVARLSLRAPPGEDPRRFTLWVDAVTHEVRTHRVQVMLRSDWDGGLVGGPPVPLGTLDSTRPELPLDLGANRPGAGVGPLVIDGARHILEGLDHLLFLLLLLVVAPLRADDRGWRTVRQPADAARRTAWIVSAFTLGHSVTLALGSSGLVTPPAPAVEAGVALTIGVAAVHALRPLWRGGEPAMALAFGLVHGLAFSASLSGAGLGAGRLALALLSFNGGIEVAQLALVLAAMPALAWIARRSAPAYAGLRRTLAVAAGLQALLWLGDRLGLGALPAGWPSDVGAGVPWGAVAVLWLLAAAVAWTTEPAPDGPAGARARPSAAPPARPEVAAPTGRR